MLLYFDVEFALLPMLFLPIHEFVVGPYGVAVLVAIGQLVAAENIGLR